MIKHWQVVVLIGSHPSRVRGLKLVSMDPDLDSLDVAPFAGAWIEISNLESVCEFCVSRTLRGCVD